jgi:hypothetical protein
MSTFYYSKKFKQSTGTNYTDYVSRVRTEKAKTILLNRNSPVSEIAYEVGFQSLAQFNRVFKRITGEAPTEFRRQLQKVARNTSGAQGPPPEPNLHLNRLRAMGCSPHRQSQKNVGSLLWTGGPPTRNQAFRASPQPPACHHETRSNLE